MAQSLSLIHPDWVAAALGLPAGHPALAVLASSARTHDRVLARVLEGHGLTPRDAAIDPRDIGGIDAILLAAAPDVLLRAARWAGAAWHGQELRRTVLSRDVARLVEGLGEGAFAHARRAAVPRAPDPGGGPGAPQRHDQGRDREGGHASVDFLIARTRSEAEACLAAWCASLPRPLTTLVRLRFAMGPSRATQGQETRGQETQGDTPVGPAPDGARALTPPLPSSEMRARTFRRAARDLVEADAASPGEAA